MRGVQRALAYTITYWPCAPRLLPLWARAGRVYAYMYVCVRAHARARTHTYIHGCIHTRAACVGLSTTVQTSGHGLASKRSTDRPPEATDHAPAGKTARVKGGRT